MTIRSHHHSSNNNKKQQPTGERLFFSKLAPQISMAIPLLKRVWLTRQLCIRCYDNLGRLIEFFQLFTMVMGFLQIDESSSTFVFHSFPALNFNLHSYSWRHTAFVVGMIYPIVLNIEVLRNPIVLNTVWVLQLSLFGMIYPIVLKYEIVGMIYPIVFHTARFYSFRCWYDISYQIVGMIYPIVLKTKSMTRFNGFILNTLTRFTAFKRHINRIEYEK